MSVQSHYSAGPDSVRRTAQAGIDCTEFRLYLATVYLITSKVASFTMTKQTLCTSHCTGSWQVNGRNWLNLVIMYLVTSKGPFIRHDQTGLPPT
jgi:hypothetical protein